MIETTLVHVAREATTNIMKHAPETDLVRIHVDSSGETVSLTVWNRSAPAHHPTPPPSGFGLRRMEERLDLLEGSFTSGPDADGWRVACSVPRA